ncbi:DUF2306 domain-containing protein [Thermobifida halotolerans]|uniref:DUF2306 domain-containing protein n=1 Tax=Thermobifida halotolerans TaxID=483545 RepID=A0AA97LW20_9ACTN|nr:DUF2306 domain-containing protein [Thermobifida halotolerans]UOE19129.1 DUF2306 domain-containing protein [Thermobifida halotolerans]
MATPDTLTPPRDPERPRRTRWPRASLTVAVTAVSCVLITLVFVPTYLTLDPDTSRIEIRPDSALHFPFLVVHAVTGGVALLSGPPQFSRRLRRHRTWHRWTGRVYLFAGVLPSALTGIVAALLTPSGPASMAAFLMLDVLWITTALAAYHAARTRRFAAHREWMLRNFALTFSAVTLRLWLGVLIAVQLPWLESGYNGDFERLFDTAYAITHWVAWLPNLLLMEVYLARHAAREALTAARQG